MTNNGLLGAKTVHKAALMLKDGSITATELVQAAIDRIHKLKHLNAFVSVTEHETLLRSAADS
jgi:Asp-tRNA(Asn)/Glu-tRNA(Gln) amidotransferase A subunit family amidase